MSTKNITGDHDLSASVERGQDGPRTVVRVHGVDGGAGELLACQWVIITIITALLASKTNYILKTTYLRTSP